MMKFADYARNAVRPLSDDAIDHAISMICHLEEMPDVGALSDTSYEETE